MDMVFERDQSLCMFEEEQIPPTVPTGQPVPQAQQEQAARDRTIAAARALIDALNDLICAL